jgi:hypothetical protein
MLEIAHLGHLATSLILILDRFATVSTLTFFLLNRLVFNNIKMTVYKATLSAKIQP